MERHDLEGIGFYVYLLVLSVLTVAALIGSGLKELGVAAWRWMHGGLGVPAATASEPPKTYRFQALLPRLFRLIVVPIALAVDFDHSYLFPMHASNAALLMLMILAFLTTSFFVRRELRARQSENSRLDDEAVVTNQRRRMRQTVSIALAHSFAVALLFSFIFESNFIGRTQEAGVALASLVVKGEHTGAAYHQAIEGEAGLYHDEPYFLGVLPREAECNLTNFCHAYLGMPERYAQRMRFHFYPTLILTWTALGLFFGVFLDGFLKGEHLRGEVTH